MVRFTLKQIEYFIATAECGSITLASERVRISQPSISTAIAHLEQTLETQLFIRRHAQGLTLTPEGRILLAEAKRLVEQAESLYHVASDAADKVRGNLSLGCLVTFAPMVLPDLCHSFAEAYPQTSISSAVSDHEDLLERVQNAELDAALTYDLLAPEPFQFIPLAALPPHAVMSASHPLASRERVSLAELAEEPLILLDLPISREYFLTLFTRQGLEPRIGTRSTHPDVIRTMAANGFGYTLANVRPRSSISMDGKPLARLPLEGTHKPTVIGVIALKQARMSRLLETFVDHCRALVRDDAIPGMDPQIRSPALDRSGA